MSSSSIPTRPVFGAHRSRSSGPRLALFALQCALGIAAVLLLTLLAHGAGRLLPVTVLLYLLIVISTAVFCGFWQAVVVSLSAMAAQSYPIARQLAVNPAAASAEAATLLAFGLVALIVSRLCARLIVNARAAESGSGHVRELYEFTQRTLQMNLHAEPGPQLAESIHRIFALEAVAVFDADLHNVYQAGMWSVDPQELARNVYYFESSDDDPKTGIGRRVVRLGAVPVGSLVVRGETGPRANDAIAALIAITFDRYRAFANESRIETERRTEQLRATVLDGLAHAYKTPLTAIRAASTGLGEMGHLSPGQAELVALIDEQTGLLSELTTRLLTTARMDAGEIAVHAAPVSVGPLIEEVLAGLKDRLTNMKVKIDLEDDNLVLCCDRQLMIMLLTQYIDNACKYSIFGTAITIRVFRANAEAVFSVHSFGPVIPVSDRERIFDRYYRSATFSNGASGTGIGLSVAKRVAAMHGGYVWVTSDELAGTTFFAAIPAGNEKGSPR